jgi:two-component system sensor histidine kinase BaeS
MLAVTLVALAAVTVTALLSVQAATQRVGRLLDTPTTVQDAGRAPAARGQGMAGGAGPAFAEERRATLRRDLWRANLQSAGIALLVAAAVGVAFAARLARPLRALTLTANRYASGERGVRASEAGHDEVAEVAHAFNRMADRLHLEEEQQQRLIADIAHELRTPLTVLKGELEALEDGLLESEPATFRRLGEEVTLLERLVQDLRLLTQAESGELPLRTARVDLAALVDEVCTSFAAHARQREVDVVPDVGPGTQPVVLTGDPQRLRQILANLLENAVRHAPPGSRVDVGLRREDGHALLTVRDRGEGIPEAERERVFQRFYRIDRARSRATGGSGLGLAIVRTLAELHGGSVAATSHPHGGAVLSVRLPLGDAPGVPQSRT